MRTANLIKSSHPSFGYGQAWFLFALTRDNAMVRLFLIEAQNAWAIQTIERIVVHDGKVSSNCELMSVHRHCPSVGIRSKRIIEVKYVDFMLDIVEPGRLMQDALTSTGFERSLSSEEKKYASAKLDTMMEMEKARPRPRLVSTVPPPRYPLPPEFDTHRLSAPMTIDTTVKIVDMKSTTYQQATAILVDLGFKKSQVKKVLDEMDSEMVDEPIEKLIKVALQQLQSIP